MAATEGTLTLAFKDNLMDVVLCDDIALRGTALDGKSSEIEIEHHIAELGAWAEEHFYDLGLAVGIGTEVAKLGALGCASYVILSVASYASDAEALSKGNASLAIGINGIVDRAGIVLFEDSDMHDARADINLLINLLDDVATVGVEDNDVVEVGAIGHVIAFLEAEAHKTILTVDIEFLVALGHLGSLDIIERADLGEAVFADTILFLDAAKMGNGEIDDMVDIVLRLAHILLEGNEFILSSLAIELEDTRHLDFEQVEDIVAGHAAHQLDVIGLEIGLEAGIDMSNCGIDVLGLLKLLILINTLLDENLLEGEGVPLLSELIEKDLQLLAEEIHGAIRAMAKDFGNAHKVWLAVHNDASVGRDGDFAIREGVEGIDGLIGRCASGEMDYNLGMGGRKILNLTDLNLLIVDLEDGPHRKLENQKSLCWRRDRCSGL